MPGAKIVFGGGAFMFQRSMSEVTELLNAVAECGIEEIDTAATYGQSEVLLGKAEATSRFTISTKVPGGLEPVPSTRDGVVESCKACLHKLETRSASLSDAGEVDILYIHAPDTRVPIDEVLAGIDDLHKAGAFNRFGLSNFKSDQVEEVIRICQDNNYLLPSVFQGNYSAIARRPETELMPLLRKHNMAFYAYSPIAGGFLAKSPEQLAATKQGRWNPESFIGKLGYSLYAGKQKTMDALATWDKIAMDEDISKVEMAYRWIAQNSALDGQRGDAVIIGAQDIQRVKEVVDAIKKGPLSEETAERIDRLWEGIKGESPLDNFNDFLKDAMKG